VSTRRCSRTASPAPSPTCSRLRPRAARAAGAARAVVGHPRRQPAAARRAREADHELRG
jgi:hypothetical protein